MHVNFVIYVILPGFLFPYLMNLCIYCFMVASGTVHYSGFALLFEVWGNVFSVSYEFI